MYTYDKVDFLLCVVLEYRIARVSENVDWEICQSFGNFPSTLQEQQCGLKNRLTKRLVLQV